MKRLSKCQNNAPLTNLITDVPSEWLFGFGLGWVQGFFLSFCIIRTLQQDEVKFQIRCMWVEKLLMQG